MKNELTYQDVLSKVAELQTRIKNYKRTLKEGIIGSVVGVENQLYHTQVELDTYMLLKIQHELLSYLKDGGLPSVRVKDGNYLVSIPGVDTVAILNEQGIILIIEFAEQNENQKAAELLRSTYEEVSNKSRTTG